MIIIISCIIFYIKFIILWLLFIIFILYHFNSSNILLFKLLSLSSFFKVSFLGNRKAKRHNGGLPERYFFCSFFFKIHLNHSFNHSFYDSLNYHNVTAWWDDFCFHFFFDLASYLFHSNSIPFSFHFIIIIIITCYQFHPFIHSFIHSFLFHYYYYYPLLFYDLAFYSIK